MPPEGYKESEERKSFYMWVTTDPFFEKELTTKQKIKRADKKRIKAVKKENYLDAAKYRDIIKNLKK